MLFFLFGEDVLILQCMRRLFVLAAGILFLLPKLRFHILRAFLPFGQEGIDVHFAVLNLEPEAVPLFIEWTQGMEDLGANLVYLGSYGG